MNCIKTLIDGVVIIEPRIFVDERGYFFESFSQREFNEKVRPITFVQDNENKSSYGVLRGLHYQKPPYTQSKLVRVVDGAVIDVAVDIRNDSPTFKKWVAVELSSENHRQLFLPRGMAHAMLCISPTCIFTYKVDNFYNRESEGFIAWNDPDLAIDWQIPVNDIILSEKDCHHKPLKESEFLFEGNLY